MHSSYLQHSSLPKSKDNRMDPDVCGLNVPATDYLWALREAYMEQRHDGKPVHECLRTYLKEDKQDISKCKTLVAETK